MFVRTFSQNDRYHNHTKYWHFLLNHPLYMYSYIQKIIVQFQFTSRRRTSFIGSVGLVVKNKELVMSHIITKCALEIVWSVVTGNFPRGPSTFVSGTKPFSFLAPKWNIIIFVLRISWRVFYGVARGRRLNAAVQLTDLSAFGPWHRPTRADLQCPFWYSAEHTRRNVVPPHCPADGLQYNVFVPNVVLILGLCPRRTTPPRIPHRSFTTITQYTVHTSRVRLDDEISTSAAH